MFPSELLDHTLWWNGPTWLLFDSSQWPKQFNASASPPESTGEERELSLHTVLNSTSHVLNVNDYSSFMRLKRVTAWIIRFIHNCRNCKLGTANLVVSFISPLKNCKLPNVTGTQLLSKITLELKLIPSSRNLTLTKQAHLFLCDL